MSNLVVEKTPITFEEYMFQQRVALEHYCLPFFQKFEEALKSGQFSCDFTVFLHGEFLFPWSLVAHELSKRYPNEETRVISLMYDPGPETEIYVDTYTIRFESRRGII